jgi:dihydroorotase
LLNKTSEFEKTTGLEIRKHFFKITDQYTIDSILKQIEEHKWYLSEKSGNEVEMSFAAKEWIEQIYNPIIKEFNKLKIFEYFQNTNSLKLYTDIMAHKYYLSLEKGEDVGIYIAIRSYSTKHSDKEESLLSKFIEKLLKRLTKIVPPNYNL